MGILDCAQIPCRKIAPHLGAMALHATLVVVSRLVEAPLAVDIVVHAVAPLALNLIRRR